MATNTIALPKDFVLETDIKPPEGFVLEGAIENISPLNWQDQLSPDNRRTFNALQLDENQKNQIYDTLYFANALGITDPNDIAIVRYSVPDLIELTDFQPHKDDKPFDTRKHLSEAVKHGYRRAGVMMVKQLAGIGKVETELGGRFREWAWGKTPLGRKPKYLAKIDENLKEWSGMMLAAVQEYYKTRPEEAIQIAPELGYLATLKEYVTKPENLVQGIIESAPLMLEGILGTVTGGTAAAIVTMALPISGEVYADAREEGTEPIPAFAQALLVGTGEAAIESWTLSRKLGLLKGFRKMIAEGLPKILWEGTKAFFRGTAEEGSQEFNRNFWRWVFTDRSQDWLANVTESMAAGGPIEMVMAGGFSAAGAVATPVTKSQQVERLEKIRTAVNENTEITEGHKAEINKELDQVQEDIQADVYAERAKPEVKPAPTVAEITPEPAPAAIKPVVKAKPTPPTEKIAPAPAVEGKIPTDRASLIKLGNEITKKLGIEKEIIWGTLHKNARHTRGSTVANMIDVFVRKDATLDEVKRVMIHELDHVIYPPPEGKGISELAEYERETRTREDVMLAKLEAPTPSALERKPAKEPEVEIRDLSEKTRKAQIKQTEETIKKHEIYQLEQEGIETRETEIGRGKYYIQPNFKGELLGITGKPYTKGFKKELYDSFTFDPKEGRHWDEALEEAGLGGADVSELINRVDEAIEAGKKIGVLNARALERATASGDPYFELLAMKREMLRDGLTATEINDNIKEQAKHYKIPEETITDLLVPVERVEYVEKKPRVVAKVAAKGRAAKAKLSPEQTALTKAKQVARKLKRPAYVYQKEGRFIVSKNLPTIPKLTYREVQPPEAGKVEQEVSWQTVPEKYQVIKEGMANVLQRTKAYEIAEQKGLISKKGKPTPKFIRFAKAMTGKTRIELMTEEEAAYFIDMLGAVITDYRGVAKIPNTTDIITKELADKIGKFRDIGALERIRPAWRVFEKIGLYKEVFEPAFEAEISSTEELFGFREEAKSMQKLVGKGKDISQKLFQAIENPGKIVLTENEKKVIDWGKKHLKNWADRLELTLEQRRKNYITHIFEREINQLLKEKHPLDPDLIRALDFITPKTVFNPYLQKRLGKKVGLKEDFWAALEAYEGRAVKKFYYEPLIKRLRVYERFLPPNSARYLRNYITRITSRPLVIDKEVNQTLKEVAQEIAKLPTGKNLARYLTKGNASAMLAYNITGIYYECWLGLRPASAIKNLSQHGLVLAETGPVAFTKALKIIGTERATLLANSKVLRSRKLGYLPGIDQTFIQGLESKRRKITMAMFRAADRKNVSDAFLAGYLEAKAKGLSDEWAYKRGDEVAAKTQWLYSKLAGSQLMQSSPGRVLGVLTTWPENWAELMNDWIRAKPSSVYTDYAKETGKEIPKANWAKRRKSLWTYFALVSLAMLIHKKTPFKAIYYTGWTSIRSLVDIASGKLPGLEIPRIIGNLIVALALWDKRRLKQSWNEMKRFPVIVRELTDIISGKKDWMNLFIYMETKKGKKGKPVPRIVAD